jgi:hypothetical protein
MKSVKTGDKTESNREFHADADEFGGRAAAAAAGFLKNSLLFSLFSGNPAVPREAGAAASSPPWAVPHLPRLA